MLTKTHHLFSDDELAMLSIYLNRKLFALRVLHNKIKKEQRIARTCKVQLIEARNHFHKCKLNTKTSKNSPNFCYLAKIDCLLLPLNRLM